MKIIAIFGSRHQDDHLQSLEHLFKKLLNEPSQPSLCMEERLFSYISPLMPDIDWSRVEVFGRLENVPDVALSIGGDGTFLRVAKIIGRHETPILGINTGHLGYLAAASIDDAEELVNDIVAGHYCVESRSLLRVYVDNPEIHGPRYALNEVAMLRRDTASMIDIEARLSNEPLAQYRGDGLIVSTPTGSTGYNLSVGGPLVDPATHCWIVSPIAPHSLNMRPLVIPDSFSVVLRAKGRASTLLLSLDGKATVLPIATQVKIDKAPFAVNLVMLPGQNFIHTIRTKLLWGTQQ